MADNFWPIPINPMALGADESTLPGGAGWENANLLPIQKNRKTGQWAWGMPNSLAAALSGIMAPGKAANGLYERMIDPTTGVNYYDGMLGDVSNLAGMLTLGSGAIPRPANALNMGVAYHGSPYNFDKFSMDKIGTGEGAQAFGHGLYFAGNRDVADWYRDSLTYDVTLQSQRALEKSGGDVDAAIASIKAEIQRLRELDLTEETGAARRDSMIEDRGRRLENLAKFKETGEWDAGALYTVDIPDDADLLDWDAPLNAQPQKVKEALAALGVTESAAPKEPDSPTIARIVRDALKQSDGDPTQVGMIVDNDSDLYRRARKLAEARGLTDADLGDGVGAYVEQQAREYLDGLIAAQENTGERLYRALGARITGEPDRLGLDGGAAQDRAATEALREKGIPGIRYLDAGSRADGDGSRNYVIFNDELVKILGKK